MTRKVKLLSAGGGALALVALYLALSTAASPTLAYLGQELRVQGLSVEPVPAKQGQRMHKVFFVADGGAGIFGLLVRVDASPRRANRPSRRR